MSQSQLDSAVAQATGETLATIQRRGFSPLPPPRRRFRARYRRKHRNSLAGSPGLGRSEART